MSDDNSSLNSSYFDQSDDESAKNDLDTSSNIKEQTTS